MKAFGYSVFTGIAILLSMVIVSCNDDADSGPFFDEYGRPLVTVAVQAEDEQGRSLNADIIAAIFNFYEVVVRDDTYNTYYRAAGSKGAHLFLRLPENLDLAVAATAAPKAVIFAGYRRRPNPAYNADLILLAIGNCTAVNGTTPLIITPNTTSITFTLVALENDIIPPGTGSGYDGDFRITGPAGYRTDSTDKNYHILLNGAVDVPYFELPHNRDDITARLHITGLTRAPLLSPNPVRSIYLVEKDSFNNTQFMWGGDPILLRARVDDSCINLATRLLSPTSLQTLGGFPISINTKPLKDDVWTDGWALLSLGIPVKIHADMPDHLTWYICTGMFHDRPDTGYEELSLGGGILIRVGDPYHDPDF